MTKQQATETAIFIMLYGLSGALSYIAIELFLMWVEL